MKVLPHRAYGSIPHLLGSRRGPADRGVEAGQHRICTEQPRDKHDEVFVQVKLDGSNVAVVKQRGAIVPVTRAGYHAESSPFEQHHLFAAWVARHRARFDGLLGEGEQLSGEWLAQAHGTRYALPHEPFVAFDLFAKDRKRATYDDFLARLEPFDFTVPALVHRGGPLRIEAALERLEPTLHGALDPHEGAVWRVERRDPRPRGRGHHVDFLAKYVRPDKVDGCFLPERSGGKALWLWRPEGVPGPTPRSG